MKKILALAVPLILFFAYGCSSNPVEPDRNTLGLNPDKAPFQLAIMMVCPELGDPLRISTNVPTGLIVPRDRFHLFATYAFAAFDVYDYEPNDWDDWLLIGIRNTAWEPDDWDDWLLAHNNVGTVILRKVHYDGSLLNLANISLKIDPCNLYRPDDWNNWLLDYEPNDWDDWLFSHTINDIAALND
jgi:hypothetical protein